MSRITITIEGAVDKEIGVLEKALGKLSFSRDRDNEPDADTCIYRNFTVKKARPGIPTADKLKSRPFIGRKKR